MSIEVFSVSYHNTKALSEGGAPTPAATILVTRERCAFAGGAPYHWYVVVYEDASGGRHELLETSDPNRVVREVKSQISMMPRSFALSIWYDLPPHSIEMSMSRDKSGLHSEVCKWIRREVKRIEGRAQKSRLPVEWADEIARLTYLSDRYKPGGVVGHRLDIVLLRVVRVDSEGSVQFRYRLLREVWSRRGLFGWLSTQRQEELTRRAQITISDQARIGQKIWSLGLELGRHKYSEVGREHHCIGQALAADYRLLEEIERKRRP